MDIVERRRVREEVSNCVKCPLHKVCTLPVPFSGPSEPLFAVVGEAPGRDEDEAGAPFVGVSGQLLKRVLANAGVDLETVAFLNTVSCYPGRTPTAREVGACSGNLHSQLEHLQARYVLLVGGTATTPWIGGRISEVRGHWFQSDMGWFGYGTWHPAAVLRNDALRDELVCDIEYFLSGIQFGVWKGNRCVKCGRDTDITVNRELDAAPYGIPYCAKHLSFVRGDTGRNVRGRGKGSGSKVTKPRPPKQERML